MFVWRLPERFRCLMIAAAACLFVGGCSDLTYEAALGQRKCPRDVEILLYPPPQAYVEVGNVSTPEHCTDAWRNYREMQKRAARLGGDAVILTDGEVYAGDDFWTRPHYGVAIAYTTSSLHD